MGGVGVMSLGSLPEEGGNRLGTKAGMRHYLLGCYGGWSLIV